MSQHRSDNISDKKWERIMEGMNRRDFILTSLAAGVMTLTPRFVGAQAGKPYKLGVLLPSTGTGANYVENAIKGIPLAVAEINAKGGFLGRHPIEIVYRDDQTKPDVGAREAKSIILNDNVQTIIGTYSSAVALAIEEITHEHKVLHIAATSNSSKITQDNYSPYTYQFCPDSNMQSGAVVVAVSKMVKKNNWKTFVSLSQDYEWGRDTHKGFTSELAKAAPQAKETKQLWFKLGETDFTSYITAIMAAKPDFLFGAIAGKDSETFLQQAGQMGLFKRVPFPGGLISVTELRQLRKTLPRGIIGLARCPFFAHLKEPLMQKYIKMHRAKFGNDNYPDDWACMHYDAVYGLEQAINKAKSIETEAVVKALKGATLDYRDLPVRLAEFGTVYRYEQSGELGGMTRVRGFTQDDAHLFCTEEQVGDEFRGCIEMTQSVLKALGMNDYRVRLGFRDPTSDKYVGSDAVWERAEKTLEKVCRDMSLPNLDIERGEAAFYGPKADFVVSDCLGREWQLGTVQLDYNLPSPERFGLEYIGADNQPHQPVMIHRAPLGSLERFVGVLIEHFAGAFPLWLAPEQVRVLTVSEKSEEYGRKVEEQLRAAGMRVTGDFRAEKLGSKIRDAQLELIPYMLVVGPRDAESGTVSVRDRISGDLGAMPLAEAIAKFQAEVAAKEVRQVAEKQSTGLGERGGAHEY